MASVSQTSLASLSTHDGCQRENTSVLMVLEGCGAQIVQQSLILSQLCGVVVPYHVILCVY